MHFIEPENRQQLVLINKLDDMVGQNHYVRLIDLIVDKIVNAHKAQFVKKGDKPLGRKAYAPSTFLKLYIYGYFNGISSSRKLERETHRNVELIWLLGDLSPDFKTIADFRKDNSEALRFAFNQMNIIFKEQGLISGKTISIDGTKMRVDASKLINAEHIPEKLKKLNDQLTNYMQLLETNDQQDDQLDFMEQQETALMEKIARLQDQIQQLESQKDFLEQQGIKKYSPTDPEAKMMKSRQGTGMHYNVQMAVDEANQLITTVKATSRSNDKGLLLPVLDQLQEELNIVPQNVLADSGYYVLKQLEGIEKQKNINCYVAVNLNSSEADDKNNHISFTYDEQNDQYSCTGGEKLSFKQFKNDSKRGAARVYQAENCHQCALKSLCTKSANRSVYRYDNHPWREAYKQKMKSEKGRQMLAKRQYLSERPFAYIKYLAGNRLKLKNTQKVNTEMLLYAMAYNLKRVLSIYKDENILILANYFNYNRVT